MIIVDDNRIELLLLQLSNDVAWIKAKLDNVDEIKSSVKDLGDRVDHIEAQNERHEHELKALEHRCDAMEKWTRDNLNDSNKTQRSVFISVGLAVVSAVISLVFNMI